MEVVDPLSTIVIHVEHANVSNLSIRFPRARSRDGDERWVESVLTLAPTPHTLQVGDVYGMNVHYTDVTHLTPEHHKLATPKGWK